MGMIRQRWWKLYSVTCIYMHFVHMCHVKWQINISFLLINHIVSPCLHSWREEGCGQRDQVEWHLPVQWWGKLSQSCWWRKEKWDVSEEWRILDSRVQNCFQCALVRYHILPFLVSLIQNLVPCPNCQQSPLVFVIINCFIILSFGILF